MIRFSDVEFRYRSSEAILTALNHSFRRGQLVALTGPSGRGKSTMLYLAGLVLTPTDGTVFLDGVPVSSLSDHRRALLRASKFGFVFQDAALDPSRTVLDNVLETALYCGIPRRTAARRAHELLDRFGVDVRADHRPGEVSGGQAQRIALCRALMNNPSVLLADEPTGNLDLASTGTVLSALREQARAGSVVVVATHDPAVTAACDERVQL